MKSSTLKLRPLITFRVTAQEFEESNRPADYFNVFIWSTEEELRLATGHKTISGLFRTYTVFNFDKGTNAEVIQPFFGEMHLYEDGMGVGIVSHECTHAAMEWAHRHSLKPFERKSNEEPDIPVNSDEERFCWMVGNLVRQVFNNYEDHLENPRKRKLRMIRA